MIAIAFSLVMAVTLPALAACGVGGGVGGGGGDGTALVASKATLKIILTNGTPNTPIAGVDVTLILPDNAGRYRDIQLDKRFLCLR